MHSSLTPNRTEEFQVRDTRELQSNVRLYLSLSNSGQIVAARSSVETLQCDVASVKLSIGVLSHALLQYALRKRKDNAPNDEDEFQTICNYLFVCLYRYVKLAEDSGAIFATRSGHVCQFVQSTVTKKTAEREPQGSNPTRLVRGRLTFHYVKGIQSRGSRQCLKGS